MATLVQFDFKYTGPFGAEMVQAFTGLAESIAQEPGFVWKLWTENESAQEAGGIYLFADEKSAQAYVRKQMDRLRVFGIQEVNVKVFDVNAALSAITNGPLPKPHS